MLDQRTLSAGPAAAGWYADPLDPARLRWWDGESWTARLAATKPSGPTRRAIPDLPAIEDTVPAVPPTRIAFDVAADEPLAKTRELPVVTEVPVVSPDRPGGVSLATDPIASLENLFSEPDDEAPDASAEISGSAAAPFAGSAPLAAPLAAVPAAVAASFVVPPVAGPAPTQAPAPAPATFEDTEVPTFLTDAAGDLTLPKRHRAEVEPPAVDPAAFVPGGRRARRHAEALAAASAAPTEARTDETEPDETVPDGIVPTGIATDETAPAAAEESTPDAPAVSAAEVLAAVTAAAVPAAPSPAAAAAAAPLIAAAVAPELVEPVLTAALAAPADTAEIVARINREAREHDEPVQTASLPVTDEDEIEDEDVDDAPVDAVPVVASALPLPVAPSVLPTRPEAEHTPAFTLPKALATPAPAPAEATPHFEWKAGTESSAAPAQQEDDELNEFAGVFGSLTPSNRVTVEAEPEKWSTGAAWTLALAPVLTAVIALGIAVLSLTGSINEAQTRWYVIGANLVLFAVFLLSAMADRRALKAAGHTRTASEFWLLLSPLGYLIARTIRVRRQLGRGSAPLWVHVAALVAIGAAGAGAAMLPQAAPAAAESQYEAALEQALAAQGTEATVTCPADIAGTVGATYTCTAVAADGSMLSLGIEMQDEGRFAYTVSDAAQG